jgi:pimeloyl-ACP methyl ester carboxylesterase/prenyltransferase beta subunit
MMRTPLIRAACVMVLSLGLVSSVAAQTPAELQATAAYLASFQNPDGGFAPAAGQKSSLGTTSSIIRSLGNIAGSVKDVPGAIAYVKSCCVVGGGFSQTPGGEPSVSTTAIGLMAYAALKISDEKTTQEAIAYLSKNAKSFEDVRIAVAGLEAVNAKLPDFEPWTRGVSANRNADGSWGQGDSQAFATGGAAAALLRMGVPLDNKDAILKAMRAGQRPDGAWSRESGPSDLEASYRIMRCFFMLKEKPDLEKLMAFISRCRHSDGSYSSAPDKPGDPGGCYYATTIIRWARLMSGEPAVVETAGFQPLFNGKSLDGWEGDTSLWSAQNGMLVGKSAALKHNDFLATTASYGDFILKFSFRMLGDEGSNSGMQFRSVRVPGHEMSGYQADIGQGFWGSLYDESRRNKVLVKAQDKALASINKGGWNQYVVRAMGNHITLTLNGQPSVDYKEDDPAIARAGKIATQIHAGGPMEVQFKDLYIQALPTPIEDSAPTPGFQLRTVKAADGERKYVVYLPRGYDGTKVFPVVLFLHGSGERGDDGIVSAQVGLGPNIQPERFAAIAVIPQAKRTWAADSDDIKAALAALDDVLARDKADAERVALTGLSMGGSGAWGLAAAQPERFSCVVPICGRGRLEDIPRVKDLPVWVVEGDADRDATVQNARQMVQALRDQGKSARFTEYRSVGHNSWDRAYSDAALIDWMLSQIRRPKL